MLLMPNASHSKEHTDGLNNSACACSKTGILNAVMVDSKNDLQTPQTMCKFPQKWCGIVQSNCCCSERLSTSPEPANGPFLCFCICLCGNGHPQSLKCQFVSPQQKCAVQKQTFEFKQENSGRDHTTDNWHIKSLELQCSISSSASKPKMF